MASLKLTKGEVLATVAEITALVVAYVAALSYGAVWMSSQLEIARGILMS